MEAAQADDAMIRYARAYRVKYTRRGFRAQVRKWWRWKNLGEPRKSLGRAIADFA